MEALVVITVLLLLAILAPLAGHDSRARMLSKEEDLAAVGMTWDLHPGEALTSTGRAQSSRVPRGLSTLGRAVGAAASQATALLK